MNTESLMDLIGKFFVVDKNIQLCN